MIDLSKYIPEPVNPNADVVFQLRCQLAQLENLPLIQQVPFLPVIKTLKEQIRQYDMDESLFSGFILDTIHTNEVSI